MLRAGKLPPLVIASTGTTSNTIEARGSFGQADVLVFQAPATLTGTVTLQASLDGSTFAPVTDEAGSDVTLAAGKIRTVENPGWVSLRLVSGSAEAATRTFLVRALERYGL